MNMNMHITNIKSSVMSATDMTTKSLERVLERTRRENTGLQHALTSANVKSAGAIEQKVLSDGQLTLARAELAAARRTIAELEAKVKSVTASLEAMSKRANATSGRKEKTEKTDKIEG